MTKDVQVAKDEVVKITEASKKGAQAVADEEKKQKEAEIKKLNDQITAVNKQVADEKKNVDTAKAELKSA